MPANCASRLRGLPAVRPCTVGKLAGILPAIAARLFLHLLAATWREPGKSKARQSLPQKLEERAKRSSALCPLGPSVKRRRSDGSGRVHRTRCGPGRPAFGDRAGALPPNPVRPQRTGRRPALHRGCISLVTFFVQAKKVTRPPGMAGEAQQGRRPRGCETSEAKSLDSRLRGNDGRGSENDEERKWIPAFAGMTIGRPSPE
jgi:hypothetical protein